MTRQRWFTFFFVLAYLVGTANLSIADERSRVMAAGGGDNSPLTVIGLSFSLLTDQCDLDCCLQHASLFTDRYLDVMQSATVASMRADRSVNTQNIDYHGELLSLTALEAIDPKAFHAWQTLKLLKELPARYRYSEFEVLRETQISDTQIEYFVILKGVLAEPSTQEESLFRLRLIGDRWFIDL